MPKLPHISGEEAARAFEKLGFRRVRQNGSHLIMRRGTAGCVVPMHKEIKTGTLAGVLRQSGVTADELLNVL